MIDIDYLKQLLDIFDESTVNDLRIDKEGTSIRLTKNPKKEATEHAAFHYVTTPPAPTQSPTPTVDPESSLSAPTPSAEKVESAPKTAPDGGGHVIASPIVGTFYRSPSPDAPPFVEIGSRIQKGEVLCIIEAMKLMNEIESDVDGEIVEIYPQNGQAVEFGEPLFLIRT